MLLPVNPGVAIRHVLQGLPAAATTTFLALFHREPVWAVPLFFSLTTDLSSEDRNRTALRIALWVSAILVVFMLFGRFVLNFFGFRCPC